MVRAGYGQADITPRGRCDINGFIARKQPSLGVGKPLKARLVMIESGRFRSIVAVCDLLGFSMPDSVRLEAAIGRAADVPAKNVLLACTHTHSGPMSMSLGTIGRFRPQYIDWIEKRIVQAAREARKDLDEVLEARLGTGAAPASGTFRCATDASGRGKWPGTFSAIELQRSKNLPIVAVHFSVHPYVLGPKYRHLHPDYPGELCDHLEKKLQAAAIFLPGCGADVQPIPGMTTSKAAVRAYGKRIADKMIEALKSARPIELEPARAALVLPQARFGFLPRPSEASGGDEEAIRALEAGGGRLVQNGREWQEGLRMGKWPKAVAFRTHILRLGELVLIGMPAELFWNTGVDIAASLKTRHALTVSQAGGDVGYLPRPFAYDHLTYETTQAHQWYRTAGAFVRGTEAAARRAAVSAAKRL